MKDSSTRKLLLSITALMISVCLCLSVVAVALAGVMLMQ